MLALLELLTRQKINHERHPSLPWHKMQNAVLILRFVGEQTANRVTDCTKTDILLGRIGPLNSLLSYIRHTFDHEFKLKDVSTNVERRRRIAEEIRDTEATYVTMISKVQEGIIDPIKKTISQEDSIISPEELKEVFSNLPEILNVHSSLLQKLNQRFSNWNASSSFSDIFIQLEKSFTELYIEYVANFDNVTLLVKYIRKKKPHFKKLIKDFEKEQAKSNALDLASFLILPVQRLPRYVLLLLELEKFTDEGTVDKDPKNQSNLENAIASIKRVLEKVDESKTTQNEGQKIATIQRNMELEELELVHPKRKYIMEGVVRLIDDEENTSPYCFLFNDILLLAESRTDPQPPEKQFKYSSTIPLAFCEGITASETDPCRFDITTEAEEEMGFICTSKQQRDLWVKEVECQMKLGIILDFQ